MATRAPAWSLSTGYGHVIGVQVRASQALLALAEHREVVCPAQSQGGAWLCGFTLDEQYRLYRLGVAELTGEAPEVRGLLLTASGSVGAHLHDGLWLGLLDAPRGHADAPRGGMRVWQLGAGTAADLAAGPPDSGPWRLPHAVDAEFLRPAQPLGPGVLWLAQDGPPEASCKRLAAFARDCQAPVHVFDATGQLAGPNLQAQLPTGVTVMGLAAAGARRAFYAGCSTFVVDSSDGDGDRDDLWQLEAQALGLRPHGDGDTATPHEFACWADVIAALLPAMEGAGAARERRATLAPGRTLRATAQALAAPSEAAAVPRALLLWGRLPEATSWPALAQAVIAQNYQVLFAQVGPHTPLLPPLMLAGLQRLGVPPPAYTHRQDPEDLWQAACQWLQEQGDGGHLDVLIPGGHGPEFEQMAQRLALLQAAHDGGGGNWAEPLPLVAINGTEDIFRAGASHTRVGAQVASADIGSGVAAAAPGRLSPRWLQPGRNDAAGKALFMHPLTRPGMQGTPVHQGRVWNSTALRMALCDDKVDAILVPRGPMGAALQMVRAQYARKPVPLVHVLHGVHHVAIVADMASYMLHGPVYPWDAFIAPSQAAKKNFVQLWGHVAQSLAGRGMRDVATSVDVPVIPYGIDTGYFAGRHRLSCRLNLALPPQGFVVLSLCRLVRRFKACLLPLLLATQALRRAGVQVHLVIAGEVGHPQEVPRLRTAAQDLGLGDHVTFVQNVSLADKAQLLAAADVYVALSDNMQESHGIALIEAMAAGLPVVAAAWDGFREVVVDGETGMLVPTRWADLPEAHVIDNAHDKQMHVSGFDDLHETVATDVGGLAQALTTLAGKPELRRALGAAGQRRAQTHFDATRQGVIMADLMLDKIATARAAASSWSPAANFLGPDPIGARFAHYPSHWVDAHTSVHAGPWADDAAHVAAVMDYIDPNAGDEAAAVQEVLATLGTGTAAIGTLVGPRMDMLRLMRCLKYDLLRVAQTS